MNIKKRMQKIEKMIQESQPDQYVAIVDNIAGGVSLAGFGPKAGYYDPEDYHKLPQAIRGSISGTPPCDVPLDLQ